MKPERHLIGVVILLSIVVITGCATQKPTLQNTVDGFLKSCAASGIDTREDMFEALEMAEFIQKYGGGESAHRDHHDELPTIMQFAISKSTGEPSSEFFNYILTAQKHSRHRKQAALLGEILGMSPLKQEDK